MERSTNVDEINKLSGMVMCIWSQGLECSQWTRFYLLEY